MSTWNTETAEWYANNYGEYATNKLGIDSIKLTAASTVIDVGCGTGSALRHASQIVTNGTLIGVDPVPRMVEIAREQTTSEKIVFFEGSAENLPIEDEFADFVLAFDSFDHWQDKYQGLKEVHRVLKSNGRFVVVKDGDLPNANNAKEKFIAALDEAGFKIHAKQTIEKGDVKFTHWVCVIKS